YHPLDTRSPLGVARKKVYTSRSTSHSHLFPTARGLRRRFSGALPYVCSADSLARRRFSAPLSLRRERDLC
ncbi:unnamed protein product, partial [Amoebophrya sp. A25]